MRLKRLILAAFCILLNVIAINRIVMAQDQKSPRIMLVSATEPGLTIPTMPAPPPVPDALSIEEIEKLDAELEIR